MKTIIKMFWISILWIFAFFFGVWLFNHYCAWRGIAICVVSVMLFIESVLKSLIQNYGRKEDEKD